MLEFEKSFFIGEEQSGYYVDSFSKRCKAAQLEILARVDDICKKYNIKYMMDGGTLLGAVRHGGFIPWDDDIDIMMERSDYNRFLEIIKTEMVDFTKNKNISYEALGGKLFYTNMYTDPYYDQIQTIIGNWHGIKMDDNFLQDYHGCPISQLIDVFPYDYWPEENDETVTVKSLIKALVLLHQKKEFWDNLGRPINEEIYKSVEDLGNNCGYRFDFGGNVRNQVQILSQSLASIYSKDESKYLVYANTYVQTDGSIYDLEWYKDTIYFQFENMMLPAQKGYDGVLKTLYGDYNKIVIYDKHKDPLLDALYEQIKAQDSSDREPYEILEEILKDYV